MRGYVLVFHPNSGTGTIVSEGGRSIPFSATEGFPDLQGGDVVRFNIESAGVDETKAPRSSVREIEVIRRGADRLADTPDTLVEEFYRTLRGEPARH
ncbi:MAG: hypothetical protein ACE5E1_05045 [Phycisphaerae bacterium]